MNESYLNFRTDMADERVDTYKRVHNLSKVDGVEVVSKVDNEIITTTVNVLNENGKKALSKDIGKYVTMEIQDIKYIDDERKNKIIEILSKEIAELIGDNKEKSILVVGLGNEYVTPDALGPKVIKNIDITRHMINYAKELVEPNTREVSAISPGVLGTTGIETFEIINSVVKNVNPDMVVVIDSLASGSIHRVGTTIQLSNTGITPGAGVRNKREGLNEDTLNVPVIAIGVPTVVDMATITNEAIDKMIENEKNKIKEFSSKEDIAKKTETLELLENNTRYNMIANVLDTENYIVTPKEVDELIITMSDIISSSINLAV